MRCGTFAACLRLLSKGTLWSYKILRDLSDRKRVYENIRSCCVFYDSQVLLTTRTMSLTRPSTVSGTSSGRAIYPDLPTSPRRRRAHSLSEPGAVRFDHSEPERRRSASEYRRPVQVKTDQHEKYGPPVRRIPSHDTDNDRHDASLNMLHWSLVHFAPMIMLAMTGISYWLLAAVVDYLTPWQAYTPLEMVTGDFDDFDFSTESFLQIVTPIITILMAWTIACEVISHIFFRCCRPSKRIQALDTRRDMRRQQEQGLIYRGFAHINDGFWYIFLSYNLPDEARKKVSRSHV